MTWPGIQFLVLDVVGLKTELLNGYSAPCMNQEQLFSCVGGGTKFVTCPFWLPCKLVHTLLYLSGQATHAPVYGFLVAMHHKC
jgi:hypothetical protein